MRASEIDFANFRELFNALKTIEKVNFGEYPSKVIVSKVVDKKIVGVRFEYPKTVDRVEESKKINSFFLDKGFKNFTLTESEDETKFILSTIFRVTKAKV